MMQSAGYAKALAVYARTADDEFTIRNDIADGVDLVVVAAVRESGEFGEQGFQTRHRRRQAHEPVVHRGHCIGNRRTFRFETFWSSNELPGSRCHISRPSS